MKINKRIISPFFSPYIIAEMSANHNGNINNAYRIIDMAKDCGADAVKIQTYRPDTITMDMNSPEFMIEGGLWDGISLYELYQSAYMPWEWHQPLFNYAKKIGITIFSSPFDNTAVDFLEELDVGAYKIASPEITNIPLIKKVAKTGKPIIISSGLSEFDDLDLALKLV